MLSYECELRRSKSQCKSKIKVKDNEVVCKVNEHTHGPDMIRIENLKALQEMESSARDTQETPQQIISQAVEAMNGISNMKNFGDHYDSLDDSLCISSFITSLINTLNI